MNRKYVFYHAMYYTLVPMLYIASLYFCGFLLNISPKQVDLGAAMAVTYAFLFLMTPILTVLLMRFSLLPLYFDPIAAAEIPLSLYIAMIVNNFARGKDVGLAVSSVNLSLCDDGGMGWIFLTGLFILGLAATFSPARKRRKSVAYRILTKLR